MNRKRTWSLLCLVSLGGALGPSVSRADEGGPSLPLALSPTPPAPLGFVPLLATGTAIGAASSASGALLGAGLGSLSNHLAGALLVGGFANLLLPPLLTALSLVLLGNLHAPGRFSLWQPLLSAFASNAAVYLVVSLALPIAVGWANPVSLLVYALLDGVVMSAATTGVMALTERKPPLVIRSTVPGADPAVFASLSKVEF